MFIIVNTTVHIKLETIVRIRAKKSAPLLEENSILLDIDS